MNNTSRSPQGSGSCYFNIEVPIGPDAKTDDLAVIATGISRIQRMPWFLSAVGV